MVNLRDILVAGDYLVVEDSNINGHPVAKSFGPGPYEAIQEYFRMFPQDYDHDFDRERKFGFSFRTQWVSSPTLRCGFLLFSICLC